MKFATTKTTLMKHKDSFFTAFLTSDVKPDEKGSKKSLIIILFILFFCFVNLIGYYFIDRTPTYFGLVLGYLRDGNLDLEGKTASQIKLIKEEFDYFLVNAPNNLRMLFYLLVFFFFFYF